MRWLRLEGQRPKPWYEHGDMVWVNLAPHGHVLYSVEETELTPEGQYLSVRVTGTGHNSRTSVVPSWKVSPLGFSKEALT